MAITNDKKKLFDRILKIWYGFAIHDACTDILFPCRIDWGYIDNKIVVSYFDDILKDSYSLFLIIYQINEIHVMINDILLSHFHIICSLFKYSKGVETCSMFKEIF